MGTRILPQIIVGEYNDSYNLVKMKRDEKIHFTRARTTGYGIEIFMDHLDELREGNRENVSYQLPNEKKSHVVLRGLCGTRILTEPWKD